MGIGRKPSAQRPGGALEQNDSAETENTTQRDDAQELSAAPARACAFPAQELLRYRRRLLHYMTKLPEGDSSLRYESIKHSLRAIDTLAQAHESIRGCDCFIRARQRRIEVEAARRERREAQRKTRSIACQ